VLLSIVAGGWGAAHCWAHRPCNRENDTSRDVQHFQRLRPFTHLDGCRIDLRLIRAALVELPGVEAPPKPPPTEPHGDTVKILVALKRVADPDNANKVKIAGDGSSVDTAGLEWRMNPFDEYALEAALRLTENGASPKTREGEVVVVTLGPKETESTLRSALATGADRAIRIEADDDKLDGGIVAAALSKIVEEEKPDVVLLGKQAVDGDSNQVGQLLAEKLDYPMATFAATIQEEAAGTLLVGREVDGGVLNLRLTPPCVVTVDLRVVAPKSVYSNKTDPGHEYGEGVRFAPLPAIMKAKKKPLDVKALADVTDQAQTASYEKFESPAGRKAGIIVKDVAELVEKLKNEARVL